MLEQTIMQYTIALEKSTNSINELTKIISSLIDGGILQSRAPLFAEMPEFLTPIGNQMMTPRPMSLDDQKSESVFLAEDETKHNTKYTLTQELKEPIAKKSKAGSKAAIDQTPMSTMGYTGSAGVKAATDQNGNQDLNLTKTDSASTATVLPSDELKEESPSYQVTAPLITRISTEKGMAAAKEFLANFGLKSLKQVEGTDLTAIHDAALAVLAS